MAATVFHDLATELENLAKTLREKADAALLGNVPVRDDTPSEPSPVAEPEPTPEPTSDSTEPEAEQEPSA